MSTSELRIDEGMAGQTLAATVRRMCPGASWAQARQAIAARRVRVNASVCLEPVRRLTAGEEVCVSTHSAPPPPKPSALHLAYRDEHLLVVEKPAGVLSERRHEERGWEEARKAKQPTLDELLRLLLTGQPRRVGGPPAAKARMAEVFPVHRLDRATSGLMVYALSGQARGLLTKMFAGHEIQRQYLAVVRGHPAERTIRSQLVRDRGDGLRGSLAGKATSPEAKEAVTHIAPVEEIGAYSLVRCRLETGRTHQIRIHLHESGYPLCGETLYNHRPGEALQRDASGAPRLALHSAEISFTHPITKQLLHFESPLPKELASWLEGLR